MHTLETRARAYEKMQALREKWLDENGPCKKCGSYDRLEVDHIDRTTKVTHAVWSWKPERRAVELAKCQVLCHECHLQKTISELTKPLVHGFTAYKSGKCRCDICRKAQVAHNRAWRLRTGRTQTFYNRKNTVM